MFEYILNVHIFLSHVSCSPCHILHLVILCNPVYYFRPFTFIPALCSPLPLFYIYLSWWDLYFHFLLLITAISFQHEKAEKANISYKPGFALAFRKVHYLPFHPE